MEKEYHLKLLDPRVALIEGIENKYHQVERYLEDRFLVRNGYIS